MQNDYFNKIFYKRVSLGECYNDDLSFILSFSQALKVIHAKDMEFELIMN